MKKETKIEIFFWLVVLFVFSPRVFLEVYEHKLRNSLTPFENNEWTVKDKDGNVIYEKLQLPYDLRWKEQKTTRREWIFEKDVRTDKLLILDDLGIVLGRAGDSDYVMFNDCLIGTSGLDPSTKKMTSWDWSQIRYYKIPKYCLANQISAKIQYHIYKYVGPGYGVFQGPIGFGKFSVIKRLVNLANFFRYDIDIIFGLGLIFFISTQYLFVYLTSLRREVYGILGSLSFVVGIYLLMISTVPYILWNHVVFFTKLLFSSAVIATILFLKFFRYKFSIFNEKIFLVYSLISLVILTIGIFSIDGDYVYKMYEYWQPLFLISFVICYVELILIKNRKDFEDIYYRKYLIAFTIFIFCCIHDVISAFFALSSSYLIGYAFTFFVVVVALTLSKEYSDAFFEVEEQVNVRTRQLNNALVEVQQLQIKNDDQARNFAHDIRSPLVALQVLNDIISKNLSDDQRSLLKHTVIRINDLANTIIPKNIDTIENNSSSVFLWSLIDKLISEKRMEYQSLQSCIFDIQIHSLITELNVCCSEVDLTRFLSNILNNAVEARKTGQICNIIISLERHDSIVEIKVNDNGSGIKAADLGQIFRQGFTQGKKGGMGLGLTNAKKIIENFGGKIQVDSIENQGTTVSIQLPVSEKPNWLTSSLNLKNIVNLVIIDDQPYVIDAWKQKLQSLAKPFKIYWIQNMDDWNKNPLDYLSKELTMFLVDYDLSNGLNGLDMIEQLKLFPNLCIVTANEDDLKLREKAVSLGICILPKSLISAITIEI